jgi:urease accessory protein
VTVKSASTARAVRVVSDGQDDLPVSDTLLLTHSERRAPRGTAKGLRGTIVEFALPSGSRLAHDDRVMLDDGRAVEIVARPEPLVEVRAADLATLARAAWLLGDHHIPVEIHARYLRAERTDSVAPLLRTLDVTVREIEAPFEPEGGAYDHIMHIDT